MIDTREKSENEVENLVLKAARGGGLPLGLAEDLAMATPFLDLDKLTTCPCHDGGAAYVVPRALDMLIAGHGPQTVEADAATLAAYVALAERQTQKTLIWDATPTGAVFKRFDDAIPTAVPVQGRRVLSDEINKHLVEMAAKTLVPETEASRLGGAGAGLTDND